MKQYIPRSIRNILRPAWDSPVMLTVRGIGFSPLEFLTGYRQTKRVFKEKLGYDLDLKNPRSFNQKMVWKKLYDRNPLLPVTSDKYLVRQYVATALSEYGGEQLLIPLLFVGDDPKQIPFDDLPKQYIIKTNHSSGGNVIVTDNNTIDRDKIIEQVQLFLRRPYGNLKHEWAYQHIQRKIIIEQLLIDEQGNLAQDYKIHVFHGTCRFIHTTPKSGSSGERSGFRSLFTPDWQQLPVGWKYPQGPNCEPPSRLHDMVHIAEKLAAPFDYVRVDLYNPSSKIYFGELTHYHGSGMEKFEPGDFDFEAGKWWRIRPKYWLTKHET